MKKIALVSIIILGLLILVVPPRISEAKQVEKGFFFTINKFSGKRSNGIMEYMWVPDQAWLHSTQNYFIESGWNYNRYYNMWNWKYGNTWY